MNYACLTVTALCAALCTEARAAGPDAEAGGSASGSSESGASAEGDASGDLHKRKDHKWIKRWAPERHMGELGVYGGILVPSSKVELFDPDIALPDQGHRSFKSVAPDFGLRFGYYPLRFLGVELEGGLMPTKVDANDASATLWTVRGHAVVQIGLWSVTPFVLIGGGAFAVSSDEDAVGSDVDQALHVGGGLKFFLSRWLALRVDVRDIISPRQGLENGSANSIEALLGLSLTLGRKKAEPPPPPKDTDGDGFLDPDDKCVTEPGIAPDGCPPGDRDGDGFLDPDDKCPDEAGVEPDGCPIRDTDGDGFMDPDDKCVEEPETKNGFEDDDGCPDEIPEEVKKFTGVIEGIYFDVNKDTIKDKSKPVLDNAVNVLKEFESIRVEISGHTDSTGAREHNMDLSSRRAEAVRQYLVDAGVDAGRIESKGFGPDQPIESNDTKDGRAKNRRIEFKIVTQ